MRKVIKCNHFVFSKLDLHDPQGASRDSGFQSVAATPEILHAFGKKALDRISPKLAKGLGEDPDLDELDAYVFSSYIDENYHIIAHYMRSPARAVGRSYYLFGHLIFWESEDWFQASLDLPKVLTQDLSDSVYHTYNEFTQLNKLEVDITDPTDKELASEIVDLFLSQKRKRFCLLLDGLLEYRSVDIVNFRGGNREKARLLRAIRAILPLPLVPELTFSTEVYWGAEKAPVRIRFIQLNQMLDGSYLNSNYVIDWEKGVAKSKFHAPDSSYSSLIVEARNKGPAEISRIIAQVSDLDTDASIVNGLRSSPPLPLRISARLAAEVESSRGPIYVLEKMLSESERYSSVQVYETLRAISSSQIRRKNIDQKEYRQLVFSKLIQPVVQRYTTTIPVDEVVAFLCERIELFDFPDFWNQIARLISSVHWRNAKNFLSKSWECDQVRTSKYAPSTFEKRVHKAIRELYDEKRAQEAISLVEEWDSRELVSASELYLSLLEKLLNPDILQAAIEHFKSQKQNPYPLLMSRIATRPPLDYPNTYEMLSFLAEGRHEGICKTLKETARELAKHQRLFSILIRDALQLKRWKILPPFITLILEERMEIPESEIESILNTLQEVESDFIDLNSKYGAGLAYIAWQKRHMALLDELISPYSEGFALNKEDSKDFFFRFINLAALDFKTSEAVNFVSKCTGCDQLYIILSAIRSTGATIKPRLIQSAVEILENYESVEQEQVLDLLRVVGDRYRDIEAILGLALEGPVKGVIDKGINNCEASAERLAETVLRLRNLGQEDRKIAQAIFRLASNSNRFRLFPQCFLIVIDLLENNLQDPNIIYHYVHHIPESNIWAQLNRDVRRTYMEKLIRSSSGKEHRATHRYAGNLLRHGQLDEFLELIRGWHKLSNKEFVRLLSENWHPARLDEILSLLGSLAQSAPTFQRPAIISLLSGKIRCSKAVRTEYLIHFLDEEVLPVLSILHWVEQSKLSKPDSYPNPGKLKGTLNRLERALKRLEKPLLEEEIKRFKGLKSLLPGRERGRKSERD